MAFTGYFTTSGPAPLVLVHGFTQTARSWGPIVEALAGRFPLALPDAPGHGASSEVRADLWEGARLLVAAVGRSASWAGYSMGGRMALHVALAYPDLVERLVLISATPGIKDEAERSARRQADKALAAGLQSGGLARFLSKWLAQPMFATLSPHQADLGSRMANSPAGLASSLLLAGTGAQEPLWPRLAELAGKDVLLLSGERDEKFCDVARRMAAAMGLGPPRRRRRCWAHVPPRASPRSRGNDRRLLRRADLRRRPWPRPSPAAALVATGHGAREVCLERQPDCEEEPEHELGAPGAP